jgi:YbgC/YbaW family acyl-CoA thioester hydrolase
MTAEFAYPRRVEFAETDAFGIVHFASMFCYMEEAEHSLWHAAGLTLAGRHGPHGWPRVSATFSFRNPLHYPDDFIVQVRLEASGRSSLRYAFDVVRGDTLIGTGTMITVCVRRDSGTMIPVEVPPGVMEKLRAVLDRDGS